MPIAGLVAGALCASVGWMVVTQGFRSTRSQHDARKAADQALVDDCLANVDRVIDLETFDRATSARVIHLRSYGPRTIDREVDHVIDLSDVKPRNGSGALRSATSVEGAVILEPPSIWRAPMTHAPRSAAATA